MLITNANLVTWEMPNRILEGHAVSLQDHLIQDLGPTDELRAKYPDEEVLDARGQYVLPGNICAHTHFYGAFSRGMAIPGSAPDAFPAILEKLWWPLDRVLSLEDVRFSALVCLVDAIRHGTTTLFDHHASPGVISGSLDEIAQAVEIAGLRASLCYEVTDRNGSAGAKAGIEENVRFIRSLPSGAGRLSALFGLHASLTLSEKTLGDCRNACPDGTGFHIHVAEHSIDEYDSLEKYGLRIVDRLQRQGILGSKTIVAHAVHIDPHEIELLADTKTWVSHQPRSNMNNAVGLPAVEGMLRAGIRVCLGNDGFSNAMWDEWKMAYLAHKLYHLDPRRLSGSTVVEMAITNNASLAQLQFNSAPIGIIQKGAEADLIFVDYHPISPLTAGNLPWHMIFGFNESMITTTIAAGKVLMKDRELQTLDEEKIAYQARILAGQVWNRYAAEFEK